jgi:hypothetical protein
MTRENDFVYEIIEKVYPKSEYTRKKFSQLNTELLKLYEQIGKKKQSILKEFESEILPISLFSNYYSCFMIVFNQMFYDVAKRYKPNHLSVAEFADELKTDLWIDKRENLCRNYKTAQNFLPYLAAVLRRLAIDKYRADLPQDNLVNYDDIEDYVDFNRSDYEIEHELIDSVKEHFANRYSKELVFFKILHDVNIENDELEYIYPILSKHYRKRLLISFNNKSLSIERKIEALNKVLDKLSRKTIVFETMRKKVDLFIQEERLRFNKIEAKELRQILIYIYDNH